jgi:phosphomannomutase
MRALKGRVVVDPMHGSGGHWVESFLRGGRLGVETIRGERDTLFGGVAPEPIDRNLAPLRERVKDLRALVGLATDGDADRVGAVNERGQTMTMHEVVPLVLLHLARNRGQSGGIVRTFSQSVLLKRIAAAQQLPLHETPIGFKYIADLMLREDILIGAEESGGIGVRGHIPERDGILNSLLFLEAVAVSGKTPTELVREMHREFGEFYFGRRDLHIEVARGLALVESLGTRPPATVGTYPVESIETLDGTKLVFGDESWLLFRQSGTEPVLRVYSEATSVEKMNALLAEGCRLAESFHH